MKEYDVFMALLQRATKALNYVIDTLISIGKSKGLDDYCNAKHFKEFIKENGIDQVCGVKVNKKDCETIRKYNNECLDDTEKLSEEEMINKYQKKNMGITYMDYALSADDWRIVMRDKDVEKFKDLLNYIDSKGEVHNIGIIKNDIKQLNSDIYNSINISKIETEDLGAFKNIKNILTNYHVQFLVVNQQNSNGVIINKDNEDLVANLISNSALLSEAQKADIFNNSFKDINNRAEASEKIKQATKISRER